MSLSENDKRRVAVIAPVANLFSIKTVVVLRPCMTQNVVIWMVSLDQHAARKITSASAPGDLS